MLDQRKLAVCGIAAIMCLAFAGCEPAQKDEAPPVVGMVETPKVETPKVETPVVETPKVETPKVEVKPDAKAEFLPVDMAGALNANAVGGEEGLDGYGNAYPADQVPTGAKKFASANTPAELTFNMPDFKAESNVATAAGQTIAVTAGKYSALYLVTVATNNAQEAALTLTYGTEKLDVPLKVSDWCASPDQHETQAGAWQRAGGNEAAECKLFVQKIALDAAKELNSITLPTNKDIHIFAMTLAK